MNENIKMSDSLDYSKSSVEDRLELVNNIIEKNEGFLVDYYSNHYNPHVSQEGLLSESSRVSKDLETLATYLLYSDNTDAQEDIITDYRKKRNATREASIEKVIKVKDSKNENNKSIMKNPKIKVTAEDRVQYPELKESGIIISRITKMIKDRENSEGHKLSEKEVRRLKWIRTDIQKDEIAVKTQLKKYIKFQSVTRSEGDMQALSYLRFDDLETMRILIEDYADFKQSSINDTFSYLKIILIVFDKLVEDSNLEDYMKDIMLWKIDNVQYDEILVNLQDKYDMKITKPKLSKITRETLPTILVNTYKQQKEDWIYTFMMKGNYKRCSSCKENHLATTKNFNPDKTSKSGLRSVCKNCRRESYKKQRTAKK